MSTSAVCTVCFTSRCFHEKYGVSFLFAELELKAHVLSIKSVTFWMEFKLVNVSFSSEGWVCRIRFDPGTIDYRQRVALTGSHCIKPYSPGGFPRYFCFSSLWKVPHVWVWVWSTLSRTIVFVSSLGNWRLVIALILAVLSTSESEVSHRMESDSWKQDRSPFLCSRLEMFDYCCWKCLWGKNEAVFITVDWNSFCLSIIA